MTPKPWPDAVWALPFVNDLKVLDFSITKESFPGFASGGGNELALSHTAASAHAGQQAVRHPNRQKRAGGHGPGARWILQVTVLRNPETHKQKAVWHRDRT